MGYGRTTISAFLIAGIMLGGLMAWRAFEVSAEADGLRSAKQRLRAQLSEAQSSLEVTRSERNEYRSLSEELDRQLAATCSTRGHLRAQIELDPPEGHPGTRVRISGRCFLGKTGTFRNLSDMYLMGNSEEFGCNWTSYVRGTAEIDQYGVLKGRFVVPKRGFCSSHNHRRVAPGAYYFNLGCGACPSGAEFEVTPRPFWWISSPADAMPWVARKTGLPAALPPLPAGAHLDPEDPIDIVKARHWTSVTLNFKLAPKRWLSITYGPNSIWKDGCEPPARRVVDVNGRRALLTKPDGYYKWSTIVWPVVPGSLEGQYGIHGSVRPKKALEMARTMDLRIATAGDRFDKDC